MVYQDTPELTLILKPIQVFFKEHLDRIPIQVTLRIKNENRGNYEKRSAG